jgi:hypothetical protein
MIPYQIVEATLAQKRRYVPRTIVTHVYGRQELVRRMVERHPGLQELEIVRVLEAFQSTVERLCCEGAAVNLERFVRFAPVLAGEFSGLDDAYDRKRHELRVNVSVSKSFNKKFRQSGKARRRYLAPVGPILQSVEDLGSNSSNAVVTLGNIVALRGARLRFDPLNPLDHLRFVSGEDPTRWVEITQFHRRVPSECVFLMPQVDFSRGYFEMANCLGTATPRVVRSMVVEVG